MIYCIAVVARISIAYYIKLNGMVEKRERDEERQKKKQPERCTKGKKNTNVNKVKKND